MSYIQHFISEKFSVHWKRFLVLSLKPWDQEMACPIYVFFENRHRGTSRCPAHRSKSQTSVLLPPNYILFGDQATSWLGVATSQLLYHIRATSWCIQLQYENIQKTISTNCHGDWRIAFLANKHLFVPNQSNNQTIHTVI